ncbi:MAG: ion transporter, partial [Candidatus Riflebacteria bacterium]|nr:ion transporter [Candidatus Riflebacteria bacterium]
MLKHWEVSGSDFKNNIRKILYRPKVLQARVYEFLMLLTIIINFIIIILDSVSEYHELYARTFFILDWSFTFLYLLDYTLRIYAANDRLKYIFSFYGIIDFMSILPNFASLIISGAHYLSVIRLFRLLRIFRLLKLLYFLKEANILIRSLKDSSKRIIVFIFAVFIAVIFIGSTMYVIEGEENGFYNIPVSIYWAVVTLTTVGYGDLSPKTFFGQTFSMIVMMLGFGIISSEMTKKKNNRKTKNNLS